jgi:hypothetical protein
MALRGGNRMRRGHRNSYLGVCMASGTKAANSSGIGVLGLLGVVFVTLKLTHYVDWSWWWVTIPFWGGFALALLIGAAVLAIWLFVKILSALFDH